MQVVVEAATGVRDVHLFEELDGPLRASLPRQIKVAAERLRDLRPDRRGSGTATSSDPGSHRDLRPRMSSISQRFSVVELLPSKRAEPEIRPAPASAPPHDRERSRTPAARLADDPERLPLLQLERDPVDGMHLALAGREIGSRSWTSSNATVRTPLRGVERVAEPVGDEECAQDQPGDHQAGNDDQVRVRLIGALPILGQRPPGGFRRVHAEADEEKEGLTERDAGQLEEDEVMVTPSVFGSRCRKSTRNQRAPTAWAART